MESQISFDGTKWWAICKCNTAVSYASKDTCLKMVERGTCKSCFRKYVSIKDIEEGVYKRLDGRWCKPCSGCNSEQAYTRREHAKQSLVGDWQCKSCNAQSKSHANNLPVGNERRVYNRFSKTARDRCIAWNITLEQMFESFNGKCALSGWDIDISYTNPTASLDRIDSSCGYEVGNIQWVHTMVNMSKNKYDESRFIEMCIAIANKNGDLNGYN